MDDLVFNVCIAILSLMALAAAGYCFIAVLWWLLDLSARLFG